MNPQFSNERGRVVSTFGAPNDVTPPPRNLGEGCGDLVPRFVTSKRPPLNPGGGMRGPASSPGWAGKRPGGAPPISAFGGEGGVLLRGGGGGM